MNAKLSKVKCACPGVEPGKIDTDPRRRFLDHE
jgi:hypothetical protein